VLALSGPYPQLGSLHRCRNNQASM
jgi:hypothetical protein